MTPPASLRTPTLLLAGAALFACATLTAAGGVLVPAHRTRDGSHVPPNVAPLSAGSYLARRPTRGRSASKGQAMSRPAAVTPLFARAAPIRR